MSEGKQKLWPLEVPEKFRTRKEDKRILCGGGDMNALHPAKYEWAWQSYLDMQANRWRPSEIPMGEDKACWMGDQLTDGERRMYWAVFGMLTSFDLLRARDISDSLKPIVGAAELRQALTEQEEQEALHSESYQMIVDLLGFDHGWVYGLYRAYPALKNRMDYAEKVSKDFEALHNDLDLSKVTPGSAVELHLAKELIVAVAFWYGMFEGQWFTVGLTGPILSLKRRNLMSGTAQQFSYIFRDEVTHVQFGINLINELKREVPGCWCEEVVERIMEHQRRSAQLEKDFIEFAIPEPVFGYSAEGHMELTRFTANRRLQAIGLEPPYPGARHPYPWIDELLGTKKEASFFEVRSTEYQKGADLEFGDPDPDHFIDEDWMTRPETDLPEVNERVEWDSEQDQDVKEPDSEQNIQEPKEDE